ncbi:hypothetical protein HanPI659440_Chr00c01g0703751 [Helianthus annuus]|nr:hypothetical protein HanHA300_Chr09g0335261 [Helianthus annuus]KAJ0709020.1 hypothetical protein HanLR1_Chr09g0335611 [Helianthus annuus]KAJ0818545.1 hypothetical protein HanPI659440_Chr00c01g0703751 [Helianthus annuus]
MLFSRHYNFSFSSFMVLYYLSIFSSSPFNLCESSVTHCLQQLVVSLCLKRNGCGVQRDFFDVQSDWGVFMSFTSFLGHSFLPWSPCFYALLGIGC